MMKIPMTKAPHITKVRPPTEPYEFHRARQRAQQKDMKEYLKGRVVWRSCVLVPTFKKEVVKDGKKRVVGTLTKGRYDFVPTGLKKMKLQGTYVAPVCPLCNRKEKKCNCLDNL